MTGDPFAVGTPLPALGGGGYTAPQAAPTVTGISPAGGPEAGGTTVTITGTNFNSPAVRFGSVAASGMSVFSATEIRAVAPAGTGVMDVTVTTPGGTSAATGADRFTYAAPPSQTAPGSPAFSDVPPGYWAAPSVATLAQAGIIEGFGDGTFRPDAPVTRAQFVKMLDLTLGLPPTQGPTPFDDVAATDWFAPYVATALQAGIVQGLTPTTFGPNGTVTREQTAVLVARALHLTGTATVPFTDEARIDAWAVTGVAEATAAGYVNGFPDGTFRPLDRTTRAQAATVLALVLSRRAAEGGMAGPAVG